MHVQRLRPSFEMPRKGAAPQDDGGVGFRDGHAMTTMLAFPGVEPYI
jgi:hypothetical protein